MEYEIKIKELLFFIESKERKYYTANFTYQAKVLGMALLVHYYLILKINKALNQRVNADLRQLQFIYVH